MGSSEDLAGKIGEALRHPKADLLFEIGLEEPTPTKAAQRAQREGLSNEEEKISKWIAVFKRDHGAGWFRALRSVLQLCCSTELREILENTETENSELGLTKTQKKALENIKPENVQEALDILINRSSGSGFITLKSAFDPQKVKKENLEKLSCNDSWVPGDGSTPRVESGLLSALGMTLGEVLESIPDPEPGHENYLLAVNCLPLAKLMKFVVVDGKRGECFLNENEIEDIVEVPKTLFYWRYDIEDGGKTLGKKPVDAEKFFKEQGERQGFTAREAVCFAIARPDVLKDHGVWAVGSRYGSAGEVPLVSLDYGARPRLGWYYVDRSHVRWGSASCGSR